MKFGLEVSTRDVGTSKVTSVLCLFCKHCGRDDGNDGDDNCCQTRKRKRTTNIKYFLSPWRSDNFSNHLKNHLVVKKAFNRLCSDRFLNTITGITCHLRRQQNLQREMKSVCPTFVCTRWISMGKLLKWLKNKRIRLQEHFAERKPSCTPAREWWLVVLIIQPLVELIEKTFLSIQGFNALVQEQRQELHCLINDISSRCNLKGPLTAAEKLEFVKALEDDPFHGWILQDYCVERKEIFQCIDEVGAFVESEMDELKNSTDANAMSEVDQIASTVANFSLEFVVGVSKIVAERNSVNKASDQLPPICPLDLCSMDTRLFTASLKHQRRRLRQCFNDEGIEQIDQQFRNLRIAVREEKGLATILLKEQASSNLSTFENCWSPLRGRDYDSLRNYCRGIASVMPGTASVESDFSIINWTKDPNPHSLTHFSLEAILHCKQFGRLRKLFEE